MQLRRKKQPPVGRQRTRLNSERQQPTAFSYYAQRSVRSDNTGRSDPSREEPAHSKNFLESVFQRAGLLILAIVIVVIVINNLILSSTPRVIAVASGSQQYFLHSKADYEASIASILKQSVWNTTKLTINAEGVGKKIQEQFPELASVSVALPLLGHRPVVYIAPNQPALIISAHNDSFIVDTSGTAVLPVTQLPSGAKLTLPVVTDQAGVQILAGHQALTADNVAFIQQVSAQLKAGGVSISSLTLPRVASELDVYISGQPYFVKFNMHASPEDARSQAGTFIAVQKKLQSESITPSQYIDVRVDGRAYYQ